MRKYLFIIVILTAVMTRNIQAVQYDYYDMLGSHFMYAERLFYIEDLDNRIGGAQSGTSLIGMYDKRWMEEFKSHVVVYETYDNIKNIIELGRTPTRFTGLTMDKTLFGPSYLFRQQQGFKFDSHLPWVVNQFTFLFTRTDFEYDTNTDWTWEENLGEDFNGADMDEYFVGSRIGLDITKKINLGVSYVNQHSSFHGVNQKVYADPFAGSDRDTMYKGVSIRFADASPDDGRGGAAVYSIKVYINGVERPELGFENNGTGANTSIYWANPVGDHQEANGGNLIDFWFDFSSYSDIRDIELVFDVANDYSISYRTDRNQNGYVSDDNYIQIFSANGNIKDYKNRKTIRWNYGELTGKSIYGIDLKGALFDISFSVEYALLANYRRMPGDVRKEYPIEYAQAYFFRLLKEFRWFEVGAEYFQVDWDYNAGFAVEDNDDNDMYPDITDDPSIFDGGDGINFKTIDKNNNGINDYDEDFLLFDNDIFEFREGDDNNNNDVFDNEENDDKPDYPYNAGERGVMGYISVNPIQPLILIFKNIYVLKDIAGQKNQTHYLDTIYTSRFFRTSEIYIKDRVAYIRDTIPDDTIDHQGETVKDKLNYENNLNNSILIKLSSEIFSRLAFLNSFYNKYDINGFTEDLSFSKKEKKLTYATLHKVKYTYTLFPRFDLVPLFKISWLYRYSIHDEVARNFYNSNLRAGGIELIYNWTKRTKLLFGYQKLFTTEFEGNEVKSERDTFGIEFTHTANYWDRPLGIIAGMVFVNHNYLSDSTDEDYRADKFYVHSYFNW
ncbi:MAG: hypothetical protein KKH98_09935 [Spirochaetes bacterium]|nr:hypothetical protein [Spirochaetota bacterium]